MSLPIEDWETCIYDGDDCLVEVCGPVRAREMARAENAHPVYRHRDGHIVKIYLDNYGQDYAMPPRKGNAQQESHDHETDQNPRRVWTHKRKPRLKSA